jgi:ubiquinone/menaquinone biosynthesis C-methylase UbiE
MKQDKVAEIVVGYGVPEDYWLDHPAVYRVKRAHLGSLGLIPPKSAFILDAGCGPGTYGIILAQEGGTVVGIDISFQAMQMARERAHRKSVNFVALVGDMEALPFKDSAFDVCFCGWALHHLPNIDIAVANLRRVLRPGGRVAWVEPNESNLIMRFSRFIEDLPLVRKWILRAGWDTPNRTVHTHNHYIEALERQGFTDIELSSCFPGGLPPLPIEPGATSPGFLSRGLIQLSFRLRVFLFTIAARVLPRPLNGADLLITGTRKD